MPRTKLPTGSVPVTFRLPQQVQKILAAKARRDKISFSELVRRALRREIKTGRTPGAPNEPASAKATARQALTRGN